jgi:flagellar biosynthesis protein FlhF
MSQQRYRFVVGSAEEAVTVLRDRLGENARVVSVRQVEGTGLAKFLQAPKLEVVAELVSAEQIALEQQPTLQTVLPAARALAAAPSTPALPAGSPGNPPAEQGLREETPVGVYAPPRAGSAPHGNSQHSNPHPAQNAQAGNSTLHRLLAAGGISTATLARLFSSPEWDRMEKMPPRFALVEAGIRLREIYGAIPKQPLGDRVAFLGSPGTGKTTALCKWLAGDVFVRQRRGVVLKLDLDRANPGDALAVFCEALGVPCARSIPDVPKLGPGQTLYIDVPGVIPGREEETTQVTEALDPLFTNSRVMVINAAYEAALIKRSYAFAQRSGCTHVAFTHLDELTHWGKLWEFILEPSLTPLFLSTGPNIAGDMEQDVFEAVMARTFPSAGAQAAHNRTAE